MIHVFIGTKAQYIKTAPLLRLLEAERVPYHLIDSGQHAALSVDLRAELGVPEPDVVMGNSADVSSIPQALRWSLGLAAKLGSRRRLRAEVFGDLGGVCVVHGDTPSTLLSTLMAKRAGLAVAHLEAGLRSYRLFHPFPEELIRMIVMRRADLLFAPDAEAVENLRTMGVKGRVVPLAANTSVEAVRWTGSVAEGTGGRAVVTMHRVENLHRASRVEALVDLVVRLAVTHDITFVVHEPTKAVLESGTHADRLRAAGVELTPLMPHAGFIQRLASAPFVITDGGSVQEECALLGVPTLLWRDRSERPNGIGANVVLSHYEPARIDAFIADLDDLRRPASVPDVSPSKQILAELHALA